MKLIRGIHNLNRFPNKCLLTIGNFDGVHRGHQILLQKLKKENKTRGLPVVLMTFEPQPLELFFGQRAPARITCLREKIKYLTPYNIDYLICIRFNQNFANITAKDFIDDILVKRLGVKFLLVGDDFHFGANRQGDFFLLKNAGLIYGFNVISTKTLYENGIRISSTAIRQALAEDKLELAENLLGHPFSISGRVVHGNKLGRTIGFPTANLDMHYRISPVKGVYAVEVNGVSEKPLYGIANIGVRKTLNGTRQQLEVHLLNVKIDIYGCYIDVILRKKIRNEKKFPSLDKLKIQITNDELIAKKFFGI